MPSQAIGKSSEVRIKGMKNNDTWMDGLPRCHLSGVGVSQNQMYREDGTPYTEHEYEDRSIHFCIDNENNTYLYGVFDGHDGSKAADFASQRMPAELSFEQLEGKTSEEEVREIFQQAFISVENSFLESIDPKIAERTQLLEKIPDKMTQYEAAQQYPDTFNRLQDLEEEIRGGTTAVVALVHRKVLYVGNVGDSRALLCQKDKFGVLRVKQLTTDHTTNSEDELERLSGLSLEKTKIRGAKLRSNKITRCIGNYFLKGGYKEFDMLSGANAEPIICDPFVTSVPIDDSCSFLLLMSDGLYKSFEEATGSEHANKDIATMVVEQLLEQLTLTSVAQTVVDRVVRLHHDAFLTQKGNTSTRDDITLVIRNFNFNFLGPFTQSPQTQLMAQNSKIAQLSNSMASTVSSEEDEDRTLCENVSLQETEDVPYLEGCKISRSSGTKPQIPPCYSVEAGELPSNPAGPSARGGGSTEEHSPAFSIFHTSCSVKGSSTESSTKLSNPSLTQLTLDEEGRIHPYVSFDLFFRKVEENIANETIPKSQIPLFK